MNRAFRKHATQRSGNAALETRVSRLAFRRGVSRENLLCSGRGASPVAFRSTQCVSAAFRMRFGGSTGLLVLQLASMCHAQGMCYSLICVFSLLAPRCLSLMLTLRFWHYRPYFLLQRKKTLLCQFCVSVAFQSAFSEHSLKSCVLRFEICAF